PRVAQLLSRALASGRVAHAYAFIGPAGSGRTAAALAFAGALLCAKGGCGSCRECRLAVARQHPDLHVIVPTPPEENPKGTLLTAPEQAGAIATEAATWTADEIFRAIRLCREAREGLTRNVTPRLTMEVLLTRLALRAA